MFFFIVNFGIKLYNKINKEFIMIDLTVEECKLLKSFFDLEFEWINSNDLNNISNLEILIKKVEKFSNNLSSESLILQKFILSLKSNIIDLKKSDSIVFDIEKIISENLKSFSKQFSNNDLVNYWYEKSLVIQKIGEIEKMNLNNAISKKIKQNRIEREESYQYYKNTIIGGKGGIF